MCTVLISLRTITRSCCCWFVVCLFAYKLGYGPLSTCSLSVILSRRIVNMSAENEANFVEPKKVARKRAASSNVDNAMEVEYRGIVGEKTQNAPAKKKQRSAVDVRKVPVPAHRYTPLKESWLKIFTPIVENLQLQVRFNLKSRNVEIRSSSETPDIANLQKAADFVRAFVYGFEVEDALALLRLDNLFIETFEVKDVKTLRGEHLSRAIGRLAGKGGRTKFTIENVTKTRIVLADSKIHILGSYQNIQVAMKAVCNLILGSPPSKVYGQLRNVASRMGERL